MSDINRRQAIASVAALAAGSLSAELQAQGNQTVSINMSPEQLGQIHDSAVGATIALLKDTAYFSRPSANRLLTLIPGDALTPIERKILAALLDIIYDAKRELDQKRADVERLLGDAAKTIGPVLRTLFKIAQDSLAGVRQRITDPTAVRVAAVVGADIIGAFTGIVAASKVAPNPWLMAVGAIAGAIPASVKAWEDLKPKG